MPCFFYGYPIVLPGYPIFKHYPGTRRVPGYPVNALIGMSTCCMISPNRNFDFEFTDGNVTFRARERLLYIFNFANVKETRN